MKKLFIFAFSFMLYLPLYAQYTSPESVTYDSVYNRWLVTNSGGVIKQRASNGVVTDFAPAGSGSHAIRIHNGIVYACVGTRIKGFALSTGTEVFNVLISGSSFLNGMGIDKNTGIAYISDFTGQRIYKLNLNTQAWWIYVPTAGGQANGVYVDSPRNRLLICYWGSNAPVKSVNLSDSSLTTITSTGYSNCDGIYLDRYDNVYISSWSPAPAKIIRYDINFSSSPVVVINSGLSNPADIFINKFADTLGVPNSGNNTVTFHNISITGINPISGSTPEKFSLMQNFPNPFNPSTSIRFDLQESGFTKLYIYDVLGKTLSTLVNENLRAGSYEVNWNASDYPSGVYFYRLESGGFSEVRKMVLVK